MARAILTRSFNTAAAASPSSRIINSIAVSNDILSRLAERGLRSSVRGSLSFAVNPTATGVSAATTFPPKCRRASSNPPQTLSRSSTITFAPGRSARRRAPIRRVTAG